MILNVKIFICIVMNLDLPMKKIPEIFQDMKMKIFYINLKFVVMEKINDI